MRIAVVAEGFGHSASENAVDEKVRAAARRFAEIGAHVAPESIPEHRTAPSVWTLIIITVSRKLSCTATDSALAVTICTRLSVMDFHRQWRERANELSATAKAALLLGTYNEYSTPRYYAKAVNLARRVRAAYGQGFDKL